MSQVRRRQFLLTTGALFVARFVQAQQPSIPKIGVLIFDLGTTDVFRPAFQKGLREHGYVEGKTVLVDWRGAEGEVPRAEALSRELVRLNVNVIVANTTRAVQAAKKATSTIPIVMAPAGDPIGTGFVTSLAHPGGNVTGITNMVSGLGEKLVSLVREIRPKVKRVAVLVDARSPLSKPLLEQVQSGAAKSGIQVQPVWINAHDEMDGAVKSIVKGRSEAVIVHPQLATKRFADLAISHRLPSISTGIASRSFPKAGGLMAYGPDPTEHYERAASYVARILKGANPADLPIEQPTKFELIINGKTAEAIQVTIPKEVLFRADSVIE